VQLGIGGRSGMVTDGSDIFRLYNLESEVDGGACVWMSCSHRGLRTTEDFCSIEGL
jgi:hypothetical protein